MKRIGILAWVGMMLFVSAASAQNDAPTTKNFRVKNVRSGIVAWWIDPLHNEEPLEITYARKSAEWAGQKISDLRRAPVEDNTNPYVTRYSQSLEATANGEKPIVPREAPAGSTPDMFELPKGVSHLFNLDTQNTLLAYGTPAGLAELEKTIAVLDQPMRQVEIEAKYFSISDVAAKNLMDFFPLAKASASQEKRVFQNIDSDDIEARLKKLTDQNQVRLINSPRVTTMNNMTARLGTTQTVPAVLGVTNRENEIKVVFGKGDTVLDSKLNIGVAMNFIVTPTIQNDDTISLLLNSRATLVMDVAKENTDQRLIGMRDFIPLQTLESIDVIANIKDGEMVVVTGITRPFDPFAEKLGLTLPEENKQTQILLLVTTRIVRRNDERVAGKLQD